MTKLSKLFRGLLVCLPIVAISGVAIVGAAAPAPAPVPAGRISVKDMPDFESYPSGVNELSAANVPPLIMLVMSRDEQLFNKAYPDYTALVKDKPVNTTYLDSFAYNGYFDPDICYTYDTSSKYYKAAASVTAGSHKCATGNSYWSGNFLNWVAMSRLDVLRWTFYGGTRSVDKKDITVLERAEIPNDIHAWPKIYTGADISALTPFNTSMTFCNVSKGTTGGWNGATTTASGIASTPVIRSASGAWQDWASTEGLQCVIGGNSARPGSATDYVARVLVCQNTSGIPNESFCVVDGAALKPEGLLQKYSKADSSEKRFGLVTGSAVQARIGGQLRRNVGKLANNVAGTPCAPGDGTGNGDEFSSDDGTFCYKSASPAPSEGIVMTLDRLQITGWNGTNYGTSGDGCYLDGSHPWGARGYVLQNTPTMCPDFGNPLAGMYATALNYLQGPDAGAAPNKDATGPLPNPTWADPYGTVGGKARNEKCASCSIVLVSSGLNTFDAQNVPSVSGLAPATLTNAIQTAEGISGRYNLSTYYGGPTGGSAPAYGSLTHAGTVYSDVAICQPATIGNLSDVAGLCDGAPGQQGSYLLAGLSYGAWTTPIRTTGVVDNFKIKTYGVSLSDNLPAFKIPVGSSSLSLSPSCRANPAGTGNYTTCYIGNVVLQAQRDIDDATTYGLVADADHPNVGSYYIMWEDSQYGSDHDMDADNVISWCVGSSCKLRSPTTGKDKICDPEIFKGSVSSPLDDSTGVCSNGYLNFTPTDNDIVVRNETTSFSSAGMFLGYQISGSNADGLTELFINSGNNAVFGCSLLANSTDCTSKPQVRHFTLGTGTVPTLQTPLWYAAKYSGYTGSLPVLAAGEDPPNYFFARDAGALKDQLDIVFGQISSAVANNFGNATTPSSSNDVKGNGLAYQVQYFQERNAVKWTGSLQAFWSDTDGYRREGSVVGGKEVLTASAKYVVSGPDTTVGALPGTTASYRCTVPPVPAAGDTTFDPSTSSDCQISSVTNPLVPAWDAGTLLDAYYDPTTTAGAAAIAKIPTQRIYAHASTGTNLGQRYIFTYVTKLPNGHTASGTMIGGTQTDFVWKAGSCKSNGNHDTNATSGFCGEYDDNKGVRTGNYSLLNEKDPTKAEHLVNWVRGAEYPGEYRNRTGNQSAGKTTYRLGDIVDSSPAIVGTPAESYDLLYSDHSYSSFRANYRNRRQMVYVGANDGMLHAFNGGFYLTGQAAEGANPATKPSVLRQLPTSLTSGNASAPQGNNWPLGQEAWAFVPSNLLPHLRWMAQTDYTHVFYVDGSPVVTDAKVFTSDAYPGTSDTCKSGKPVAADIDAKGHVCGWGTIMAVPFRLGGGKIQVDTYGLGSTGDGVDHGNCNHHGKNCDYDDFQSSDSAYVLLDVTDPEQAPTVLGEIATGTYTTSEPAFAVHKDAAGTLHYYMTIGSGPADNGGPTGDKKVAAPDGDNLGVWVYDLATITGGSSTPAKSFTGSTGGGPANSFAGDMISSDFDLDETAEAVYFGVVTNPAKPVPPATSAPQLFTGSLWKVDMNTGAATSPDSSDASAFVLRQIIANGQPITIRPTLALDTSGRPMVYFGTGRSFTADDDSGKSVQGTQQQYIYGVSDNSLMLALDSTCRTMPTMTSLFDASAVDVGTDNALSGLPDDGFEGVSTLDSLKSKLTATGATTPFCYSYSGWKLKLAAGNIAGDADGNNVQVPSERVISSQTLLAGILLTPTYLPPSKADIDGSGTSDCNSVPVPGKSNLYGMNYVTGTADPALAESFGGTATAISRKVSLGSGKASAPVLHSSNGQITAAFGIGGGTKLQKIGELGAAKNGEISWREPLENQ